MDTVDLKRAESDDDTLPAVLSLDDVPGSYHDAINPRSKLGRRISDVCDDLESLLGAEREQLQQAQDILARFGFEGDIFSSPPSESDSE